MPKIGSLPVGRTHFVPLWIAIFWGLAFSAPSNAGAQMISLSPSTSTNVAIPAGANIQVTVTLPQKGRITLEGHQIDDSDCAPNINFQTEDVRNKAISQRGSSSGGGHFNNTYFAHEGSYRIDLRCWSSTRPAATIVLRYDFNPLILPAEAGPLLGWLQENQLASYFQVDSYDRDFKGILNTLLDHMASKDVNNKPQLKVGFLIHETNDEWEPISEALNDQLGMDYRTALVGKISMFSGVPRRHIVLGFSGDCWWHVYSEGSVRPETSICKSRSTPITLSKEDEERIGNVPALVKPTEIELDRAIIGSIQRTLGSYLSGRGGSVTLVEQDSDYLEMVSRGMRGVVILGSSEWERLQITITLSNAAAGRRLRIQVDGSLGSGINPPSTDQGYDRDMEPKYSRPLEDFARQLATLIRQAP
ncbi:MULTISPECIES: hypothetical protein [unclassified Bradyrhizobium]|uniref:hypothetical protein n=1 Tax=unclassified Bradyrhizobium TaxID=2631580 RepID=UPI0028E77EBA|nr:MULTISPECIES: hypothetical protein [unclassified Bradyrhizobium]